MKTFKIFIAGTQVKLLNAAQMVASNNLIELRDTAGEVIAVFPTEHVLAIYELSAEAEEKRR